ncbi:permease [Candidatus Kuenenbacteria bacterium]|nr:permease [Candidatus Kuenenbacteria bacterium]
MNIFYPVKIFSEWVCFRLLGLDSSSSIGEVVSYFFYDSIKIAILLLVIITFISFVRSYLPPEKIKKILTQRFQLAGHVLAAFLGIVTPFCSCSAVPLFIGLVESGVPLGVTFSYLVSAPMVNEVAAVLLLGLFGWKVALIYIISGVVIAVVTGFIIGRLRLENLLEKYVNQGKNFSSQSNSPQKIKVRLSEAWQYSWGLFLKIFPYVLVGIGFGATIHGYAPENILATLAGKRNFLAVPVAVIVGVPLYSNAAGIVPVVVSLIEKGLPLGTALAFMMAVTALSLPEMIILRKVLKFKLLAIYVTVLTLGIIFTGYLFNWII